jgi:hypothetical protein
MQALLLTGDWDEVEQVYISATDPDAEGAGDELGYGVALLRIFRGDQAGLSAVLPSMARWRQVTDDPQDSSEAATALAAAAASSGDHAGALTLAGQALAYGRTLGARHDGVRWAWAIAADAALALNQVDDVAGLLGWLDELPPGHVPPVLRAERLRVRAHYQSRRGEPGAGETYAAAVEAFREVGSPYHLAKGLLDHADHLLVEGSAQAAAANAAEAAAIARSLGARPLLERVSGFTGTIIEPALTAPAL